MPRNIDERIQDGAYFGDYILIPVREMSSDYDFAVGVMNGLIELLNRRRRHLRENGLEVDFSSTELTVKAEDTPLCFGELAVALKTRLRRRT